MSRALSFFLVMVISVFAFSLFSSSGFAVITFTIGNNSAAPVNNLMLNFTWTNSSIITDNVTSGGTGFNATSNVTFNLRKVNATGLNYITGSGGSNTSSTSGLQFNSTSTNASYIEFGNWSFYDNTTTAAKFSFNVSATSSGLWVLLANESYTFNGSTRFIFNNTIFFNIIPGTITLVNATFSNFTFNGTGLIMNFTASPTAPSGGGVDQNIYDLFNYTLWINSTLNNTNTTMLLGATSFTLSNTATLPGFYNYAFNISNSSDNNYTIPLNLTAGLSISQATPTVNVFQNNISKNNSFTTYPTNLEVRANATYGNSSVVPEPTFNLSVVNVSSGAIVLSVSSGSGNPSVILNNFGNGTFQVYYNTSGNANFTSASNNTMFFVIGKGILNGTITGANITYPTAVDITTAESANSVGTDVNFTFWRNSTVNGGTLVSSATNATPTADTTQLGGGTYSWILNSTGGANWTSNASINITSFNVSKGTPSLDLSFSPSSSPAYGSTITVTGNGKPTSGSSDVTDTLKRADPSSIVTTVANPDQGVSTANLNANSAYTYTYSTSSGANWTSASTTGTLSIGSSGSSAGGGGGGGGSSSGAQATVSTGSVAISITSISGGSTTDVAVSGSDTGLTEMDVTAKNSVYAVGVTVNGIAQLPSGIPAPSGTVFQNWNVVESNIANTDLDHVVIKFKVAKSWLTSNGIDASNVVLNRYSNNAWQALTTTQTSEDSNYVYFSATSPGLSYFAITGQAVPTQTTTRQTTTSTSAPQQTTSTSTAPSAGINNQQVLPMILVIVVLFVIFIVVLYFMKFKKTTNSSSSN